MKISQAMIDEMIDHARADSPNECCGLIGGSREQAVSLYRTENIAHSPLRYEMDPKELLRVYSKIMEKGQEVAAIYHSHTRTGAYPSQTDINLAKGWPDSVYIIISLEDPDQPEVKGFRIQDGEVDGVDLQIQ